MNQSNSKKIEKSEKKTKRRKVKKHKAIPKPVLQTPGPGGESDVSFFASGGPLPMGPKPKFEHTVSVRLTSDQKRIFDRYKKEIQYPTFADIVRIKVVAGYMRSKLDRGS